jgi:hypothetical protein
MANGVNIRVDVRNVTINNRELLQPGGVVYRGFQKAAGRTRDRAKVNLTRVGRVDTGRLRNSIAYEIQVNGSRISATVGTDVAYGKYIHDGTANNGTGFIYPRRATVLRFKPRGGSGFVYAKKVRGIKGTPFIQDAINDLTAADFEVGGTQR